MYDKIHYKLKKINKASIKKKKKKNSSLTFLVLFLPPTVKTIVLIDLRGFWDFLMEGWEVNVGSGGTEDKRRLCQDFKEIRCGLWEEWIEERNKNSLEGLCVNFTELEETQIKCSEIILVGWNGMYSFFF